MHWASERGQNIGYMLYKLIRLCSAARDECQGALILTAVTLSTDAFSRSNPFLEHGGALHMVLQLGFSLRQVFLQVSARELVGHVLERYQNRAHIVKRNRSLACNA